MLVLNCVGNSDTLQNPQRQTLLKIWCSVYSGFIIGMSIICLRFKNSASTYFKTLPQWEQNSGWCKIKLSDFASPVRLSGSGQLS